VGGDVRKKVRNACFGMYEETPCLGCGGSNIPLPPKTPTRTAAGRRCTIGRRGVEEVAPSAEPGEEDGVEEQEINTVQIWVGHRRWSDCGPWTEQKSAVS